jgi:hypothetical protein
MRFTLNSAGQIVLLSLRGNCHTHIRRTKNQKLTNIFIYYLLAAQNFGTGASPWTNDAFAYSVHVSYFAFTLKVVHARA